MGKMSRKQCDFSVKIAMLILYARERGLGLSFGDAFAKNGHMDNSNHYIRLAVDFNMFIFGKTPADDEYIKSSDHPEFIALHNFWRSIGGCTIKDDKNHFSVEHNGVM
ncbi:MAG: M15 family peptidase [Planctomycetes bacterium]|nr:M15 family peptidase [Planctomycetota bacterium]